MKKKTTVKYLHVDNNGIEYHHTICDVCQKTAYPSHNNPLLFFGFRCQDTNMFVCNTCRNEYYKRKNIGYYGSQYKNLYSEVPEMVPYIKIPKKLVGVQLKLF